MRLNLRAAALATVIGLALPAGFAHAAPAPKSGNGTLVIVFNDGHRQSYNLSDIERVEFPEGSAAASQTAPVTGQLPSRGRFLGKWEVGDGMGSTFFITLEENGDAWRSRNHEHGRWVYVDGEARVTWDDGWQDVIRKVGSIYQKFAYKAGRSVTDTPDNVDSARSTTSHPI